ncbi:MAG: hypothetical protein RLZZ558_821 [Planctomycetota bacterium]
MNEQVVLQALARLRCEPASEAHATDAGLSPPPSALDAPRMATRGPRGIGVNLTPLIDVTFLILVFFVCTAQVLERETLLRADLSEQAGPAVDAMDLEEPPLRIEIRAPSGRRAIVIVAPLPQPSDADDLTSVLASRRYGPENPGGLFAEDQPIELAPAADVSWERAVEIFNAVTRAGYTRVRFASPS